MTTSPVMSINDELLAELEMLAGKATQGEWWIDSHGHAMMALGSLDVIFQTKDGEGPAVRHPETGNLSHWRNDWDASFIAAANPATILALLAHIADLKQQLAAAGRDAQMLADTRNVISKEWRPGSVGAIAAKDLLIQKLDARLSEAAP